MAQNNKVSMEVTAEQIQAVKKHVEGIGTELKDVLNLSLSAEERVELLKMGDKSVAFVTKALELASQNPALVPAYLDIVEAKKDFQLTQSLLPVRQQLETLLRAVEDVMMIAGSEAYDASLIYYNSVKGASRSNVPGAQAVWDELSPRFPRKARKSPETK